MKKTAAIFCILLVLVIGVVAQASNPMIRACTATGAIVHTAQLDAPVNDQLLFCEYAQSRMIDGLSVLNASENSTLARSTYAHTESFNALACEQSSGFLVSATDLEGATFGVCAFSDGSAIESKTLMSGKNDPSNHALNHALGL